jgi:hypothetical protein
LRTVLSVYDFLDNSTPIDTGLPVSLYSEAIFAQQKIEGVRDATTEIGHFLGQE